MKVFKAFEHCHHYSLFDCAHSYRNNFLFKYLRRSTENQKFFCRQIMRILQTKNNKMLVNNLWCSVTSSKQGTTYKQKSEIHIKLCSFFLFFYLLPKTKRILIFCWSIEFFVHFIWNHKAKEWEIENVTRIEFQRWHNRKKIFRSSDFIILWVYTNDVTWWFMIFDATTFSFSSFSPRSL